MLQACFALVLIGAANTAPLVVAKWLGQRFSLPLDAHVRWFDGEPLFGKSKTVRGLLAGIAAPALLAPLFGHAAWQGGSIGAAAMAGDLLSSFCKRRLRLAPSSRALGLDQIPEVLLPALMSRTWFELSLLDVSLVVAAFFALEVVLSKWLYRLKLRDTPY